MLWGAAQKRMSGIEDGRGAHGQPRESRRGQRGESRHRPRTCRQASRQRLAGDRSAQAGGGSLLLPGGRGGDPLIHRDLGDSALHLAERLRIDPDGRLVAYLLDHLDAITALRLKQIGVATFFYAALRVTEGVGLVMEQVWAEYLTVGVTTAFLPWELYEIARHPDWVRVCLLVANLIVLAYLVWWLGRSRRVETEAAE